MKRKGRMLALCLLLAAAVAGAAARTETFRHRTEHYDVETDISPELAELVGQHMEAIYGEYADRFKDYEEVDDRFDVMVFRSREDYLEEVGRRVKGSVGAFVPARELLAAHMQERTTEEVLRTLYHEGFHQYLHEAVSADAPIWLNEGIAEYFSESTWDGRGFTTGMVPPRRLVPLQNAISDGEVIPFRKLFTFSNAQWIKRARANPADGGLQYNQAWSVVQFLVHAEGGRYADMLDNYLRTIAEGEDPDDAFVAVFGRDVASFERAWARYVMSLEPSPKFICRENMQQLMLWASKIYDQPAQFRDVSELRHEVLYERRKGMTFRTEYGQSRKLDDFDEVAALFRCPADGSDSEISYVVLNHARSGAPLMVCNHHPGIVLQAYYRRTPDGKRVVEVEEKVRSTVDPALLRAVRRSYRKRER